MAALHTLCSVSGEGALGNMGGGVIHASQGLGMEVPQWGLGVKPQWGIWGIT